MGKSFRRNTDTYDQMDVFSERRKARENKLMVRLGNEVREGGKANENEARKIAADALRRLHSSSIRSILFTQTIHTLDEDIRDAMSRGTLHEQFPPLPIENEEHPIYSHGSQRFMDQVLMPNPALTGLYFSPKEDAPLLLEYDAEAGQPESLSEEEIEKIRTSVQSLLKALAPPEEVQAIMEEVLRITTEVRGRVELIQSEIELWINILVAQARNQKSRPRTSRKNNQTL